MVLGFVPFDSTHGAAGATHPILNTVVQKVEEMLIHVLTGRAKGRDDDGDIDLVRLELLCAGKVIRGAQRHEFARLNGRVGLCHSF